jgi:4-azaleucine resistance transporter AzlC
MLTPVDPNGAQQTAVEEATPVVRRSLTLALPLAAVVGVFGISFGVLAAGTAGFGALAAIAMSATTFAGSAQFAAITVLSAGGQLLPAVVAAVLLNLRYLPIGISVAPSLRGGWLQRFLQAQLVVDESWAVSARAGGRFDSRVLVVVGVTLYGAWLIGTAVGVVTGAALGDPNRLGLDGAFPALFLALLAPQLRNHRAVAAALLGAAIALVLVPIAPAGVPIIAAASAALIGLRR